MPEVRLHVNGMRYGGWQEVNIQRSIEQIAGRFELSLTERWSGQDARWPITPGDECKVTIDDEPMITGYVDDMAINYDSGSHRVSVSGRDRTGDLVDCSVPAGARWAMRTLFDGAKLLCAPFGIEVTDEARDTYRFIALKTNYGETVFAALEAAARLRGVLYVSDGVGGFAITRASKERINATLELGENILACNTNFSHKDRFRDYTVSGMSPAARESIFTQDNNMPSGKASDSEVKRYRPLSIVSHGRMDLKLARETAIWERNVRAGRSQRLNYTVQGWTYASGKLWPINRQCHVKDTFTGIDRKQLICGVTFLADESGLRTELSLMPREAWDLLEQPEDPSGWGNL